MKSLSMAVLWLTLTLGCQSETSKKAELVKGCDRVLAGIERCFPGRADVQLSLREQYRAGERPDEELVALEEQCRVEGNRLEKDCK